MAAPGKSLVNDPKPRGVHFPFMKRSDGLPSVDTPPDIFASNIKQILLTTFGERVMRFSFGCGLKALLFSSIPNNMVLESARLTVQRAIETWEPRVRVQGVDVYSSDTTITIKVNYLSGVGLGEVGLVLQKEIS
jgi:hypothetical protein